MHYSAGIALQHGNCMVNQQVSVVVLSCCVLSATIEWFYYRVDFYTVDLIWGGLGGSLHSLHS